MFQIHPAHGLGDAFRFVVFKRDAQKFDAPVRSVRGPKTEMADPHGIYFDETHNEVFVANHGNFRPAELITSYTAYDARESRQERTGNAFSETARGRFVPSSLTVYDGMTQILSRIFRVPVNNKPITIVELTGLPTEIINVVYRRRDGGYGLIEPN